MSSPEEPDLLLSFALFSNSVKSLLLFDGYTLFSENFNVPHHVRRMPLRHRAWYFLLAMTVTAIFFANIVWNFSSRATRPLQAAPLLKDKDGQQIPAKGEIERFHKPEGVKLVALVSYTARSRTSILDCYLQANLVLNGGMLDQIIFVPETGKERDMDWLKTLVASTPGYFILDKHHRSATTPIAGKPADSETDQNMGTSPFSRSWNLALSASQPQAAVVSSDQDNPLAALESAPKASEKQPDTLYLFVSSETIFLGPRAIPSLLQTHIAHPSYAFIHANVVNQPVLSWIHHHLGVVRPYRPEIEPPVRIFNGNRSRKVMTEGEPQIQHSWRASTLPLWTEKPKSTPNQNDQFQKEDEAQPDPENPKTPQPSLFNVPIDFHSPFRGHRWLPYHPQLEKQALSGQKSQVGSSYQLESEKASPPSTDPKKGPFSESNSGSISTPVTQAMMSLSRPGKWPWILSALHLNSFLEHLECEHPQSQSQSPENINNPLDTSRPTYHLECDRIGDLSHYDMGLWQYQNEHYGLSLFLMSSSTIREVGPLSGVVNDVEVLKKVEGRGAVIDGGSLGVRFAGGGLEEIDEWRGLESTDLLGRFRSVAMDEEVGGCTVFGG